MKIAVFHYDEKVCLRIKEFVEDLWQDMESDSIECVPFFNFDQLIRAVADSRFGLIITHIHANDQRDICSSDFIDAGCPVLAVTYYGDSDADDVERAETQFDHRLRIPFPHEDLRRVLRVAAGERP